MADTHCAGCDPRIPSVTEHDHPPTPWTQAQAEVRVRLRRFCGLGLDHRDPTRDELIEATRLVWLRMGWCLLNLDCATADWHQYMDGALLFIEWDEPDFDVKPGNSAHRVVACCHMLNWIEAPWCLQPAPWKYRERMPRYAGTELWEWPTPDGWPT